VVASTPVADYSSIIYDQRRLLLLQHSHMICPVVIPYTVPSDWYIAEGCEPLDHSSHSLTFS